MLVHATRDIAWNGGSGYDYSALGPFVTLRMHKLHMA